MKTVLDSEEGIECESKCGRWFHRTCANISKNDYTTLAKDSSKKWFCNRVDCTPVNEDPMVVLTTSLNKLVDKIGSWSDKIDKIAEVSNGIADIKSDLGLIRDQISKLEPRVSTNEVKIDTIIKEVESLKSAQTQDPDEIIREVNERSLRAKNAIIHGIPESTNKNVQAKIDHDKNSSETLLRVLQHSDLHISKVIRIGKRVADTPRPVKITFSDSTETITFFRHFQPDLCKEAFPNCDIQVSRDRTILERSRLANLRTTLEARKKAGEKDLTIKYLNGVPQIVQSKN
jgi:hypothetical protein